MCSVSCNTSFGSFHLFVGGYIMYNAVSDRVTETTQIFESAAVKSKVLQWVRDVFTQTLIKHSQNI